ncbi:guanitoxin biosynthesis L-enduracididine beta-hydroxylase GntD [Paenibacillus gansuensis]|uniref:Guanitoxin biosynthesis L-enduracididine beta-hydroxylase GntD n=1 Tax=Paenibacillus gansuensis TaxID=306542 RepID=A0ABW5PID3_9BACL
MNKSELQEEVYQIVLKEKELLEIDMLLDELQDKYNSIEDPDFLDLVTVYAQELPRSLRIYLNNFRMKELAGGICVISGFSIGSLPHTPSHWKDKQYPSLTIREDIFFTLCASLLGDFIGWATQQDGYILHDVLPIKGHEKDQIGSGSEVLLTWHTEDAFHPYRTDYLGLMCLKNPDDVETTYAKIDDIKVSDHYKSILFQNRFAIKPDESHLKKNRLNSIRDLGVSKSFLESIYDRNEKMNVNPEKTAVLFGHPDSPYLRLDPYYMDLEDEDNEAMEALHSIIQNIEGAMKSLVLKPGDIAFIDNYKVVHGRKPFKARYDGNDRWLKRLNITRDLRKSRDSRVAANNRILF